jgi:hypothetical protein
MRSYQNTAFAVLDRYYVFYDGHKSDAGVGSGRRRLIYTGMDFASPQRFETCSKHLCVIPSLYVAQSGPLNVRRILRI